MPRRRKFLMYLPYPKENTRSAPGMLPMLREVKKKHDVELVTKKKELLAKAKSKKFDAIGISIQEKNFPIELKTALKVKKADPNAVVIVGGPGVTNQSNLMVQHPAVDIAVEGEAEKTLPVILDHIKRAPSDKNLVVRLKSILPKDRETRLKHSHISRWYYHSPITLKQAKSLHNASFKRVIPVNGEKFEIDVPLSSIAFKHESESTLPAIYFSKKVTGSTSQWWKKHYDRAKNKWDSTHKKEFLSFDKYLKNIHAYPTSEELDQLDIPWDLFKKEWEKPGLGLYLQRGCPWNKCIFCWQHFPSGRRMSPEKAVKMVSEVLDHGVNRVAIHDETILQNKKWTEEFLKKIIKKGLHEKILFNASVRPVDTDRDMLKLFSKAHFISLGAGVETLLPEKARLFKKARNEKEHIKKSKEFAHNCLELGIIPDLFFILSTPESTLEEVAREMKADTKFLKECYETHKRLPVFGYNTELIGMPEGPLSNHPGLQHLEVPVAPSFEKEPLKARIPDMFDKKDPQVSELCDLINHGEKLGLKHGKKLKGSFAHTKLIASLGEHVAEGKNRKKALKDFRRALKNLDSVDKQVKKDCKEYENKMKSLGEQDLSLRGSTIIDALEYSSNNSFHDAPTKLRNKILDYFDYLDFEIREELNKDKKN